MDREAGKARHTAEMWVANAENVNCGLAQLPCIAWLGVLARWLPGVEWRGYAPSCERDAKAQARLAAELRRLDEVLDQDASIRFDDAL